MGTWHKHTQNTIEVRQRLKEISVWMYMYNDDDDDEEGMAMGMKMKREKFGRDKCW